jgi:hypothetical protein
MNPSLSIPVTVPFTDDSMKVIRVHWADQEAARIEVLSKRTGRRCVVEFESVFGLRMLGEPDLASIWLGAAKETLKSTWLFQVDVGGWFELECTRSDFHTQHVSPRPCEWLIAGYQECVSVLSGSAPKVYERTKDAVA